jgi:hypothetical protein
MLMRNLSVMLHQVLKQFETLVAEIGSFGNSTQKLSKEAIESLSDILQLEIIDDSLMVALGEFLFQICLQKKDNFDQITEYCEFRAMEAVGKLQQKLLSVASKFTTYQIQQTPMSEGSPDGRFPHHSPRETI